MKTKQMALEALKQVAQALAWSAHGECRGFHDKMPAASFALDEAKIAIAALEADIAKPVEPAPGWMPIETAPKNQKEMFVVKAFDAESHGGARYTSDPWCVWVENGHFIRWPHKFEPTHWMPLPPAPGNPA